MKKSLYILTILIFFSGTEGVAQGCVAVRSGCGATLGGGFLIPKSEFQLSVNYRYFKSYKHFRSKHEETERVENGTEVINKTHFTDFVLNYGITDRLYANFVLPVAKHYRSSMYEHGGNPPNGLGQRHSTESAGLGDIRIGVGYWLLSPDQAAKGNVSIGASLKLPTGNFEVMGKFYNQGPDRNETRTGVVDQSIQLGDGGYGVAIDIQGYQAIGHSFTLMGNLYYLSNPMATNGVSTSNLQVEFSVPDQYAARVGMFYSEMKTGLGLYVGGRIEGVPPTDLIGSSKGYRRPGYAISVEPGLAYGVRNFGFTVTTPIAVERNRVRSYQDKRTGRHGDAAFADYLINVGINYRISRKSDIQVTPQFRNL